MKVRIAFALPAIVLGCGAPNTTASPDVVLTISSPLGDLTYPCTGGGIGLDTKSTSGGVDMIVICYFNATGSDGGIISTSAQLEVGNYHGPDTYVFQCDGGYAGTTCSNDTGNHAWFPSLGTYDLITWPASPGFPAASCTVTVAGPLEPSRGDRVSGSFICDPIQAIFNGTMTASSPPGEIVSSVAGQFDGTVY